MRVTIIGIILLLLTDMHFSRGDIILIPFPFTDQTDSKPRPAVVISNSSVNKTRDIILAQITSSLHNDEFSFTINDNQVTKSLQQHCEIRCHKVFTAEKYLVKGKISKFKPEEYEKVFAKIVSFLQADTN